MPMSGSGVMSGPLSNGGGLGSANGGPRSLGPSLSKPMPRVDMVVVHGRAGQLLREVQSFREQLTTTQHQLDLISSLPRTPSGTRAANLDSVERQRNGGSGAGSEHPFDPPYHTTDGTDGSGVKRLLSLLSKTKSAQRNAKRYSIFRRPPTVTAAEIDAYIANLTQDEKERLCDEYYLTHNEGFDLVSDAEVMLTGDDSSSERDVPGQAAPVAEDGGQGRSTPNPEQTVGPKDCVPSSIPEDIELPQELSSTCSEAPCCSHSRAPCSYALLEDVTEAGPSCTFEIQYTEGNWLKHHHEQQQVASDEISLQSFETFSLCALGRADREAQRRNVSLQQGGACAAPCAIAKMPLSSIFPGGRSTVAETLEGKRSADHSTTGGVAQPQGEHAPSSFSGVSEETYIRQRVSDILLANKVYEAEECHIVQLAESNAESRVRVAVGTVVPVMERMGALIQDMEKTLECLLLTERNALSEYVQDPTQFLLVPRYRPSCSNVACNAPFSAAVARVTCGRCGQPFCPKCSTPRGIGPDVVCGEQKVSLGWEPLCQCCWKVCVSHQKQISAELLRRKRICGADPSTNAAGSQEHSSGGRETIVSPSGDDPIPYPSVAKMTLKETVLFKSATATAVSRLDDGRPAFYVFTGENDYIGASDYISYYVARARASFQSSVQGAGQFAHSAFLEASMRVKQRQRTWTNWGRRRAPTNR